MMSDDKKQPIATAEVRRSGDALPSVTRNSFCCPHCGAFSHHDWFTQWAEKKVDGKPPPLPKFSKMSIFQATGKQGVQPVGNLFVSQCFACGECAIWVHDRLVFPMPRTGPAPNADLPAQIRAIYEEARSILNLSPRAAAALLRVCVEMLAIHLKAQGSKLDHKIADLVSKGLNRSVQQALDAVRVIGNEAVHPGQMDLNDDPKTAEALFKLVNVIAEKMISEPKHVDEIYGLLPPEKRAAIEKRDKPKGS
jgi:hypothetical protein